MKITVQVVEQNKFFLILNKCYLQCGEELEILATTPQEVYLAVVQGRRGRPPPRGMRGMQGTINLAVAKHGRNYP